MGERARRVLGQKPGVKSNAAPAAAPACLSLDQEGKACPLQPFPGKEKKNKHGNSVFSKTRHDAEPCDLSVVQVFPSSLACRVRTDNSQEATQGRAPRASERRKPLGGWRRELRRPHGEPRALAQVGNGETVIRSQKRPVPQPPGRLALGPSHRVWLGEGMNLHYIFRTPDHAHVSRAWRSEVF